MYIEESARPATCRPMIALTFDDGPTAATEQILDVLESNGAKATFFVVGRRIDAWRDTVLRIHESGNEVSNHTFTHQSLLLPLADDEVARELRSTGEAIASVIGKAPPPFFRPPGGRMDGRLLRLSGELGYAIILWNIDPRDWENRNADMVYDHIMRGARDGAIIVLHDTHHATALAMEKVIPELIEQGYDLVTVSELLRRNGSGEPVPGSVYRHVE